MLCAHREQSLPQEHVPQISAAVEKAGLKWSDFKVTDNSCPPHPPPSSPRRQGALALPCCALASLSPSCEAGAGTMLRLLHAQLKLQHGVLGNVSCARALHAWCRLPCSGYRAHVTFLLGLSVYLWRRWRRAWRRR